jgi:hypothetical protein
MKNKLVSILMFSLLSFSMLSCTNLGDEGPVDPRDQIVGKWTQTIGLSSYLVIVSKSASSSTGVEMVGFDAIQSVITATLSGQTLSIPKQLVNGEEISGSGTINANFDTMTFTYTNDNTTLTTVMTPFNPTAKAQPAL